MPATVDLSKLLKGLPKGAWVAISNNEERVIAYSADLQDLLEKAHAAGETDPVIVKVPEIDASLLMYHAQLPKSPTHSPISTVIRQTQALFTPWHGRVLDCRLAPLAGACQVAGLFAGIPANTPSPPADDADLNPRPFG